MTLLSFRKLYEEAIQKGYLETSVVKCLILGAAGVGKTHFKNLLLKKEPPAQRVSTGLADNPVRAISTTLAGVAGLEEDDWITVDDDQALMEFFGGTIKSGVPMTSSLADVVSTLPKIDIASVPSDGVLNPTSASVKSKSVEDEFIHHISSSSSKCMAQQFSSLHARP